MRTSRTSDNKSYEYIYSGDKLVQMTITNHATNNTEQLLEFTYDAAGQPLTLTLDGTLYYYLLNIQGDVMGLVDGNGNLMTAFSYTAYGKAYSINNVSGIGTTLASTNPLTYRGYILDTGTGHYYLQSRYYDPALGRFINADAYTTTGQGLLGNNMFAYCGNNPVIFTDGSGTARIPCTVNICDGSSGPLRDVTEELAKALAVELLEATAFTAMAEENFGDSSLKTVVIYARFYSKVNHGAQWDVKLHDVWESTIGTPYPGQNVKVQVGDISVTPEQIGNITYGIVGYAYGIPLEHLIPGSYYAAGFPTSGEALDNEISDWFFIAMGYTVMQSMYQRGGINEKIFDMDSDDIFPVFRM